jgi:hypothetical protein
VEQTSLARPPAPPSDLLGRRNWAGAGQRLLATIRGTMSGRATS